MKTPKNTPAPDAPTPDAPEVEAAEVEAAEASLVDSDQAPLELCNLVSQGHSLAEAREILTKADGKAGEVEQKVARVNLIGLPSGSPDSREGLFQELANVGKVQHPNTPTEKLVETYKREVLKEVEEA